MKALLRIATVAMLLVLAGCGTVPTNGGGSYYAPIVDQKSIDDPNLYYSSIADCNQYADRISVGQNAVGGAIIGALLGAAIGVAIGDRGSFARYGATVGAVDGAVAGGAGAAMTKAQIVRNCMAGRGYVVLDGPVTVPIGVTAQPAQTNTPSSPGTNKVDELACESEAVNAKLGDLSPKVYVENCMRRKELDSQSRPMEATMLEAPVSGAYAQIPCDTVKEEFRVKCEADHK